MTGWFAQVQPFGEKPSPDIWSRIYDTEGSTFDYVYEIKGNILMVWGGMRDSPAYYKGQFSGDGKTLGGSWVYPDGGGYHAIAKKID